MKVKALQTTEPFLLRQRGIGVEGGRERNVVHLGKDFGIDLEKQEM